MNAIDILSRAMRRIGVLASGQTPSGDELHDGLETLKSILQRMVSEGQLGRLVDVIPEAGEFTASENTRVMVDDPLTVAVTLPVTVTDTLTGETRPPRNGAVIVITDQNTVQTVTYVYDGDLHRWLPIEGITQTSEVPFSTRDPAGFAAYLAVELADEYGQDLRQTTALAAQRFHSSLINDWSRDVRRAPRPEDYF